jgi:hypothetical protein
MAAQCAPRLEPLPIGYVHVQYHTAVAPNEFYRFVALGLHPNGGAVRRFERVNTQGATGTSEIEILKLHGSLNFLSDQSSWCPNKHNITTAVEQPLILPPIFAKSYGDKLAPAWRVALERLGLAKHVIFVGYSLPATDIYMQYFLRAALGPNQDLNSIGVFDAVFREKVSEHANHLRERFRECFSESLRERIAFYQPEHLQNYGALGRFLF